MLWVLLIVRHVDHDDSMKVQTIFLNHVAIVFMCPATEYSLGIPPPGYPCCCWTLEVLQVGVLTMPHDCPVPNNEEGKVAQDLRAGDVLHHCESDETWYTTGQRRAMPALMILVAAVRSVVQLAEMSTTWD